MATALATRMDELAWDELAGRLCPACGGDLEVRPGDRLSYRCVCGWSLIPPPGYSIPTEFRMGLCPEGHSGSWAFKRLSRRLSWLCSFVVVGVGRCQRVEYEATPQGFLDPGKESRPVFETRNSVMLALYMIGRGGGCVSHLMPRLPGFSTSEVYSSLYKLLKYRRPYVLKSREKEALVATYAHRYYLNLEGLAFCYLMWPSLMARNDDWKYEPPKM